MGLRLIKHRYVLLCEGAHDANFFSALIEDRGLPHFTISSCGYATGAPRDGISHLTGALNSLPTIAGFQSVEAILIVADNDSDPEISFGNVQKLISAAEISPGVRYGVPKNPQEKTGGKPNIVVLMIPWTKVPGALDCMCWTAATNQRKDNAGHVDAFAKATATDQWPVTKRDKMKLRSLISASHIENPYMSPTYVWDVKTDLVPIQDAAFNQVAEFLRGFPGFLAA